MEFHLIYYGKHLKAAGSSSRTWEKHQIRLELHRQLKVLWETHPLLRFYTEESHWQVGGMMHFTTAHKATQIDAIAKRYEGFVPIANGDFGMLCELEVLFLRPEPPGNLVKKGSGSGDIDNRMKVLIDALSIPEPGGLVRDESDPNPIFVLLSDDSLITSLKITADTLLTPATNDKHEACVIIHANVKTFDPIIAPYGISV